jgi:hypothetical protein
MEKEIEIPETVIKETIQKFLANPGFFRKGWRITLQNLLARNENKEMPKGELSKLSTVIILSAEAAKRIGIKPDAPNYKKIKILIRGKIAKFIETDPEMSRNFSGLMKRFERSERFTETRIGRKIKPIAQFARKMSLRIKQRKNI